MSSEIREDLCPLCGQPNACGAHAAGRCWCGDITIPAGLLALIPRENQQKAYVCQRCVTAYRQNPELFRTGLKR